MKDKIDKSIIHVGISYTFDNHNFKSVGKYRFFSFVIRGTNATMLEVNLPDKPNLLDRLIMRIRFGAVWIDTKEGL